MKRAYTKPVLQLESFVPQEYVAICFNLYCDVDDYTSDNPAPNGNWYYYKNNDNDAHDGWAQDGLDAMDTHGKYCMEAPTIYNDITGKWGLDDIFDAKEALKDRTASNSSLLFWQKEGNSYKSYTLDQWTSIKNNYSNLIVTWTEADASSGDKWNHVGHLVLNGNKHS